MLFERISSVRAGKTQQLIKWWQEKTASKALASSASTRCKRKSMKLPPDWLRTGEKEAKALVTTISLLAQCTVQIHIAVLS